MAAGINHNGGKKQGCSNRSCCASHRSPGKVKMFHVSSSLILYKISTAKLALWGAIYETENSIPFPPYSLLS